MTDKSSAIIGPNVNFLFRTIERETSRNKGLLETDKIHSEPGSFRSVWNSSVNVENHGTRSHISISEDWNEKFPTSNSNTSYASNSELVFKNDAKAVDESQVHLLSSGHSLEYSSLSKCDSSEWDRDSGKHKNCMPSASLAPGIETSRSFSPACEIFSDWTYSSDSSETQASQASRGTLGNDLMGNELSQWSCSNVYPVRKSRPDCVYYLKTGKCSYGTKCKYNHPPRDQTLVKALSRRECFDFLQFGRCPYGKKCKYNHPNRPQLEKRFPPKGSLASSSTRDDTITQRSVGLKKPVVDYKRFSSNSDLSALEFNQVSSIWNKEKGNTNNFEEDCSLTSYHLWDSISVFESSLPHCGLENSHFCLNTVNGVEREEGRYFMAETCQRHIIDKFATEPCMPVGKPTIGPQRPCSGFSSLKDCSCKRSNDIAQPIQFFSTPSVELSELNKGKHESYYIKNVVGDKSQVVPLQTEDLRFNEEASDVLVTLFPNCSIQCSETNPVDRIYSYQFLD